MKYYKNTKYTTKQWMFLDENDIEIGFMYCLFNGNWRFVNKWGAGSIEGSSGDCIRCAQHVLIERIMEDYVSKN